MGDLERLFLGTMMVTGLLILGLFGLYFDLGDMVAGSFGRAGPTFSQDLDLIRERRRASYGQKKKPLTTSGGLGGPGASRPSSRPDYERLIIRRPQPSRQEMIDREIRRLQRKGYTDEQYMNMRALYQVDRSLIATFDQYDRLVAEGDLEAAIALLQEALEGLDEENRYGRRDVLRYIYQAHILAGQETSALDSMRVLTLTGEEILNIESRAEQYRDKGGQEYVRQVRQGFSQTREMLEDMNRNPYQAKMASRILGQANRGEPVQLPAQGLVQGLRAQMMAKGMDSDQVREAMKSFQAIELDIPAVAPMPGEEFELKIK